MATGLIFGLVLAFLCPSVYASESIGRLPPKVIYHFGAMEHLLEDADIDTIPAEVWRHITRRPEPGTGLGHFNLKDFRTGLYGSNHPGFAEYYGNIKLFKDAMIPWFMAIVIKDECRTEERIVYVNELPDNPDFLAWFGLERNGMSRDEFLDTCYRKTKNGWKQDKSMIQDLDDTQCSSVVAEYFETRNIQTPSGEQLRVAIVRDDHWAWSWYIRELACVEEIKGNPDEILDMMISIPEFFSGYILVGEKRNKRTGDMEEVRSIRKVYDEPYPGADLLTILLVAARDATIDVPQKLESIRAIITDPSVSSSYPRTPSMRREEGEALGPYWFRERVPAILDRLIICKEQDLDGVIASFIEAYVARILEPSDRPGYFEGNKRTKFLEAFRALEVALHAACVE